MSNVIQFVKKPVVVLQQEDTEPLDRKSVKTRKQFLTLVKRDLEEEDYRDILCGITDVDIYSSLDDQLQKIIDNYFSYKV